MNRAAKNHHDVPMSMIGSGIAIFSRRTAKLRHRHQHNVGHTVVHVAGKGGKRRTKFPQKVSELRPFIDVMIPTAYVSEGGLDSCVGLDQPRDLLEGITERALIL